MTTILPVLGVQTASRSVAVNAAIGQNPALRFQGKTAAANEHHLSFVEQLNLDIQGTDRLALTQFGLKAMYGPEDLARIRQFANLRRFQGRDLTAVLTFLNEVAPLQPRGLWPFGKPSRYSGQDLAIVLDFLRKTPLRARNLTTVLTFVKNNRTVGAELAGRLDYINRRTPGALSGVLRQLEKGTITPRPVVLGNILFEPAVAGAVGPEGAQAEEGSPVLEPPPLFTGDENRRIRRFFGDMSFDDDDQQDHMDVFLQQTRYRGENLEHIFNYFLDNETDDDDFVNLLGFLKDEPLEGDDLKTVLNYFVENITDGDDYGPLLDTIVESGLYGDDLKAVLKYFAENNTGEDDYDDLLDFVKTAPHQGEDLKAVLDFFAENNNTDESDYDNLLGFLKDSPLRGEDLKRLLKHVSDHSVSGEDYPKLLGPIQSQGFQGESLAAYLREQEDE